MTPAPYWHAGGSILHRFGGPNGFQTEYLTDAQAKERFVWFAKEALEFDRNGDRDAARYCAKQASAIHTARQGAAAWKAASRPAFHIPQSNVVTLPVAANQGA